MPATEKHIPNVGNQVPSTAIAPKPVPSALNSGRTSVAIDPKTLRRGRKTPKRSKWSRV